MALGDILVHVAQVFSVRDEDDPDVEWVDGEPVRANEGNPVGGQVFDCFLQIPGAQEEGRPGRQVKRPALLFEPFDQAGADLALRAEQALLITAPELTGPDPAEWEVVGDPEPLARPGELIGYEATLRRVSD